MAFPNTSMTDIITTTLASYGNELADNASSNTALLFFLKKRGNIKEVSGGYEIREEFMFGENGNAAWYDGYDELSMAGSDNISAAVFSPKQLAVPVVISGREEAINQGRAQIVDLLEGRLKNAEATMLSFLSVGLFSDGTGSGGKTIVGMDAMLPIDPTTGTYGGIDRSDAANAFWRSQLRDNTLAASTCRSDMTRLFNACTLNTEMPDLISAGSDAFRLYEESLQAIQQLVEPKVADGGFRSLAFKNASVILDGGIGGDATTADMYFINSKHVFFKAYKGRNMVPLKRRDAFNQDAAGVILAFMGALTTDAPRLCGRLDGD